MKTRFLFPHRFKAVGWIFFVPSAIMLLIILFSDFREVNPSLFDVKVLALLPSSTSLNFEAAPPSFVWAEIIPHNIFNDLLCIVCIVSGMLVAFSREKNEDEFIGKLRLESLMWATYANYAFLLLGIIFFYSWGFLNVLMVNMFTLLVVFIVRFNLVLFQLKRQKS